MNWTVAHFWNGLRINIPWSPQQKLRGKQLSYLEQLPLVAKSAVHRLVKAEKSYGDSWKRRGGVGAFMMLARKWDRIEKQVGKPATQRGLNGTAAPTTVATAYDIFAHVQHDPRTEGLIDDIRDLRDYLILVEAELLARNVLGESEYPQGMEHPFGYEADGE